MELRHRHGFVVMLFISLSIFIGVLTVCLTTPTLDAVLLQGILKFFRLDDTCQGDFKRIMKSSLVSSSQPRSVALGDLNNDQQIDIVVANSGTNTIGIFISKLNGNFSDQQTYSTDLGSYPCSVVVNDFNNDTCADIAVANYATNNIGIFLGRGNGTFNDQNIFSLGSSRPLFITTGDFNKDNRMDIAVVNYGTNTIGIVFGYGNGSFQNQITYSTGYDSLSSSLAVGDFNKDSYPDIVVANYGTDSIGIFLNKGDGTFKNQQTYTTFLKSNPSSVVVGDFDSDNKLDIAVSNSGTSNIGIFFGYGNGSFQAQTRYLIDSKSYPEYITVGDLNNDNKLDIAIVDSQKNRLYNLAGYGNGSFAIAATYDAISGSRPFCAAIADFNNNNQSDIVVVNYGTNNLLILTDYSKIRSARQINYDTSSLYSAVSVATTDFNNDHIYDVVYGTLGYIHVRIGSEDESLGSEIMYSIGDTNNAQYICVEDLNNDTKMDIIIANVYSDNVGVLLGHGDGTFGNMTYHSTGIGSQPIWLALGDVNNDNRLDIVSANIGTDDISIFFGNGDGTFATMITYSINDAYEPQSVAIGDCNNDNYLDLVVVTGSGFVIVFRGYGNSTFTIWHVFPTSKGSLSFAVALGNFNDDSYLDITVANTFNDCMSVFLGYGNGTFGAQTTYFTGSASRPYYVIVVDFNNDNISDIATTNFGTDEVAMFYGLGNGSFKLDRTYSTGVGSTPYGIAAGHFVNDKRLGIVVALYGTNQIAILTEYYAANFDIQTKYLTGSAPQPYSVAIGDFNNDNRSDIVVANSGSNDLAILFRLSNNTFDMKMKYEIGIDFHPQYVIVCDINNDNELDIVSVNSKKDTMSVIMGYGNGNFAEQLIYSTGDDSHPVVVASADFNNDNRLDLVIANADSDNIAIFFGFNYTVFHNEKFYSSDDSSEPANIYVSDINNDTHLDILATFDTSDKIGIFLGCGNGSFMSMMTYSTGRDSGPSGITVDDLNNDGQLDIIVTNYNLGSVGVLLGYNNGSFTDITSYSIGEYSCPLAVAVGDLNNDSRLDIIVANYGTNNVGVLLGHGNGSFSNVIIYETGDGSSSFSIALGDFDNDGDLDIAVANYGTRNVGIFFGHGNGTFGNQTLLSMNPASRPFNLKIGDFNNDNQLDIAVADRTNSAVGIFDGYGNGTFATMRSYSIGSGSSPTSISVGDFNNDNRSDIAVINFGTDSFVVLFGHGDGSFLVGTKHSTGNRSEPFALAIGDFNNDSRLDIAVANIFTANIGVFLAYGSQPFGSLDLHTIDYGSKPNWVTVGDLNKDGCADIVVANYDADNVGILFGYGDGTFSKMVPYPTGHGSAPWSIAIADFNNDTHMDIAVANSETDNILILLGYSNGTFATRIEYFTGVYSRPYTITITDLNNDNIPDIVVAISGTNYILLLHGHGDGTFGDDILYPLGYNYRPYSVAVHEFTQSDGLAFVIACYGTDHLEILIKECK